MVAGRTPKTAGALVGTERAESMSTAVLKSLEEVIEQLRRDPAHPAEAELGGLRLEVRVKPQRSAADIFREIGPWEGESTEELMRLLAEARRSGGAKDPPAL
jgi:hypothetical protein